MGISELCWTGCTGPHPGVILSQQTGQTGEKHPAVHLALLLPQEEAGAGAEDHPGQVVDDDEEEQELQSVRGPERLRRDKYFIKDDLCVVPLPHLMTGE